MGMLPEGKKIIRLLMVFITGLVTFFVADAQPRLTLDNRDNIPNNALDSYQSKMAGYTQSDFENVQIGNISSNDHVTGWKVTVQAVSNYSSSGTSDVIPVGYTSLRYESTTPGVMAPTSTSPVALSQSEKVLIEGAKDIDRNIIGGSFINYKFGLIIQGGNHLLVKTGTYKTTLIFRLYDGSNRLLHQVTESRFQFRINNSGQGNNAVMELRNGGQLFDFSFLNSADYQQGKSIQKKKALYIKAFNSYQLLVKAGSSDLKSTSNNELIPVNLFKIEPAQTQKSLPNLILMPALRLTAQDQVLVKNPMSSGGNYQEVEYDLRFFIEGQDSRKLASKSASTYSTIIYFIMIPQ